MADPSQLFLTPTWLMCLAVDRGVHKFVMSASKSAQ